MSNIKVNFDNSSINMDEILKYKDEVQEIDKILRKDPNNQFRCKSSNRSFNKYFL